MAVLSPPDLGAAVGLTFPTLYAGRRIYAPDEVPTLPPAEIPARVQAELAALPRLRPGSRVAITAGSRGIANIPLVLKACGEAVRAAGGEPFVTPAMGSHGGATAEGQTAVLAGYGVTEATVGMPVVSSMEVRQIGTLDGEMPVYMSTVALEADHVLLVNRVKPHTDFRGPVESGLAKICAIGLGKQRGAQTIHSYGTRGLAELMPRAARCMIETTGKVLGGLAILENAYDETAWVHWLGADDVAREPEMTLLERAGRLMAGLPFDQIDVLVVDEMGKNISGCGMDTNVIGRMFVPGVPEFERPRITAIVVLGLTEESHGNACGVGLADFTTERLVSQIDWQATYMNGYTSGIGGLMRNRLPNVLPTDREAIAAAIRMCGKPDPATARVVRIKNTLLAARVQLSESLLDETDAARVELTGGPEPMRFDAAGRLLS
jgi:Domain of unknown function (DUF362)